MIGTILGLTLFASGAFYIDLLARRNEKHRSAEAQVKRLQAEAVRDRTGDWARHRGDN